MTRRTQFIKDLDPVFFGLSYIKLRKDERYDLIADKNKKTVSLVLINVKKYPCGQKIIIPVLPLEDFMNKFRYWFIKQRRMMLIGPFY